MFVVKAPVDLSRDQASPKNNKKIKRRLPSDKDIPGGFLKYYFDKSELTEEANRTHVKTSSSFKC